MTLLDERAELIADLKDVITRIGEMCANGHPPKMSVPAQHYDDDLVIFSTIKRAIAALSEPLQGWVMVPHELLYSFPELNPNNYNEDDVTELNNWGIAMIEAAQEK